MVDVQLSVETSRNLIGDLGDLYSMCSMIKVDIKTHEDTDLGYIEARNWHVGDLMNDVDVDPEFTLWEAMDAEDQEGLDCFTALKQFLDKEDEDLNQDVLEISRMAIAPEHRSKGIGKFSLCRFLISNSNVRYVLLQPFPFESENPTKKETDKLKKWYSTVGFKQILKTEYMVLDLRNNYEKILSIKDALEIGEEV